VRRLILLAFGVAALLCAATGPAGKVSPGITGMSAAGSCLLSGESDRSGRTDHHWRPHHHTVAAVTESVWKSAPVHAALAATRSTLSLDIARSAASHDPPVRSTPPFLRHTPLLI
jgi:hypothetical protein